MNKSKTPQKSKRSKTEREWQLSQLRQDAEFNQWITRKYHLTAIQLESLFNAGYVKIKNNETVSARQMVEYYQEEQNVKDSISELDTQSVDVDDLRTKINDRVSVLKATSMINQKEHLKSLMGLKLVVLGAVLTVGVCKKLSKDAKDEIARQKGLNSQLVAKPTAKSKKRKAFGFVHKSHDIWDSKWIKRQIYENTKRQNFSDAIWTDIDQLKARLDSVLVRSIASGESNQKIATQFTDLVRKGIENQTYVTERVARTESAKVEFQVQHMMAKEQGFHYVKWHAEPSACKTCRDISEEQPTKYDAGVYRLSDVPVIPIHPNCRCSISAYYTKEI